MPEGTTVVLRKVYELIIGYEADPDIDPEDLVEVVGEGFRCDFGQVLARACLEEIEAIQDAISHEVYTDAREGIYPLFEWSAPPSA